jgi:transcriptional regulator with XRE-family HTH domain
MEQEDIAVALEISRGSISAYERGVTVPKGLVLRAWALATGVDEQWLRTGIDPTTGPTGLQRGNTTGSIAHEASIHLIRTAA